MPVQQQPPDAWCGRDLRHVRGQRRLVDRKIIVERHDRGSVDACQTRGD
jgi:hypothetical protein